MTPTTRAAVFVDVGSVVFGAWIPGEIDDDRLPVTQRDRRSRVGHFERPEFIGKEDPAVVFQARERPVNAPRGENGEGVSRDDNVFEAIYAVDLKRAIQSHDSADADFRMVHPLANPTKV